MTKEEIKHINSLEKIWVYEMYEAINYKNISYEKITKRQMIEEIYLSMQKDSKFLQATVLKQDLIFLVEAINNGLKHFKLTAENKMSLFRLKNAFLLFRFDFLGDIYTIPSDLYLIFKDYDLSICDDKLDEFYYFINGLLLIRGKISINEAEEIYKKVKNQNFNLDFNESLAIMIVNLIPVDMSTLLQDNLLVSPEVDKDFIINENYPKPHYSFEDYKNFGKYGLDINNPDGAKIYSIIAKALKNNYPYYFLYSFLIEINAPANSVPKQMIELLINAHNGNYNQALGMYNELLHIMPRWDFFGTILKNIKTEDLQRFHENKKLAQKVQMTTCLCGSGLEALDCCENKEKLLANRAILDDKFASDFYAMLSLLMSIVNDEYDVFEVNDYNTFFKDLSNEEYMELKQIMFDNIGDINLSPESNDAKMTNNNFQIYRGLKNHYNNNFVALEYIDQKLVLYDDDLKLKFLVSGIISPISEGIPSTDLPVKVNTTLIPLENKITYDVFIKKETEKLGFNQAKEIINKTKDIEICDNFDSFIKLIGTCDKLEEDKLKFKIIEHPDLRKIINKQKVQLIMLKPDTIGSYTSLWLDIIQSMRGVRSFNHAREMLKAFKDDFMGFSELSSALDYQPLARVLEVDGKAIGFVNGLLSYFESGLIFQIGTFGIISKYRQKGYGKIFLELLKEDMRRFNVNYLWLLPQNDGFWFKQGFKPNLDLIPYLYSLSKKDIPLSLKLREQLIDFKTFLELFYDTSGSEIPFVRSNRSFR